MTSEFSQYQKNLLEKVIRRKKLFLGLSIISVIIAIILAVYYIWATLNQPNFDKGIHFILVILILLNARQNLRQYQYAKLFDAIRNEHRI